MSKPGRPLLPERDRSNLPSPYLPKEEKPEYQAMYAFYEQLGDTRTLAKVADKFNKSRASIALVARAFRWAERIESLRHSVAQDPLIHQQKPRIDSTRKKLIKVVEEVADTLSEMANISRQIKREGVDATGNVSPELQQKLRLYGTALSVWGFEWKSPRDFRSIMQTLREIKEFAEEPTNKGGPTSATQINAEKFELHIKD